MMYDCPESDGSCWLLLVFGLCGASSKKNQIKTFEVRAGGAGGRGGVVIACVVEKTRTRTNRTRCAPNVSKETTVRVKVVWGARRGRQVRMQLLYLRYRYAVTNNTQRLDCCGFGPALLLLLCLLLLVVAFSCWSLACRRCRSSRNFPKVKHSVLLAVQIFPGEGSAWRACTIAWPPTFLAPIGIRVRSRPEVGRGRWVR